MCNNWNPAIPCDCKPPADQSVTAEELAGVIKDTYVCPGGIHPKLLAQAILSKFEVRRK